MDIAGLCLPLKPQKEKFRLFCHNHNLGINLYWVLDMRIVHHRLFNLIIWSEIGFA
jgi:hypothetical protein